MSSNRVPIACKFQLLNLMIPMSHFHFRRHKNRPYQTIGYTLQVHINIQSSQMDFKYCSLKRKPGFRHIYSFSLGFFSAYQTCLFNDLRVLKHAKIYICPSIGANYYIFGVNILLAIGFFCVLPTIKAMVTFSNLNRWNIAFHSH